MTDNEGMRTNKLKLSILALFLLPTLGLTPVAGQAQSISGSSTELLDEQEIARLWLPASYAHLQDQLVLAARRAARHEDCQEVLYGRLNEYRTERDEPSFTIMCMKDVRTTFDQVFFASELDGESLDEPRQQPTSEELEQLRGLLQSVAPNRRAPGSEDDADEAAVDMTPPEVF
ncbi:MAG TPA: hypothetical protein DD407_12430 [Pseudohongiella sp.]|nr:hypothetical protein [Gammaproteobacteria bacterium]HBN15837.1 hypothetical protein [Pseudohongiella sp.]|tara:strand:+ start:1398 stop:1919 length:522 start_codon:yes stop_codon:yes gene_type:complete